VEVLVDELDVLLELGGLVVVVPVLGLVVPELGLVVPVLGLVVPVLGFVVVLPVLGLVVVLDVSVRGFVVGLLICELVSDVLVLVVGAFGMLVSRFALP